MQRRVAPEEAGLRLDAWLARAGAAPSAAAARRLIATGRVRVDGRAAPKGARVAAGQTVTVAPAPTAAPGALADDGPAALVLPVLYEDDALLAVAKPAGVPTQSLRPEETGTVAAALLRRDPTLADAGGSPLEAGLAHRLDTGTSGVLLVARTRPVWQRLRATLSGGGSEKTYRAEVWGRPADAAGGATGGALPEDVAPLAGGAGWVVTAPIGRRGRHGAAVRVGGGRGLMDARTEITVVEARGRTSLVEARLGRGRPHQVRAHLAHLGTPIVGDPLYGEADDGTPAPGDPDDDPATAPPGLRLHALRVRLPHPVDGRALIVEAPPPRWACTAGERAAAEADAR